jgi:superfamily II DNA or RNA helicase
MNIKKIFQSAKSWKDLNKTLESFTKSNRAKLAGDIFEYLTKLYLETAPQYKSKLRKVYLEKEVPSNLRKKLNLPDTDEGIDLIAETNDKEYWAIQCKYRSNSNETLTIKEDLSTFNNLAFTHCKNITHGIVCATVNRPPKKIKLLKSIGFELLETWLGLDDGDLFTQIKAKALGKILKPKPLTPRLHQKIARLKTISHFKNNDRGKIIMPCGTGKSLTAFWIAKQMGVKSILIAVPSLALLQQTLKVWTREFLINGIEPEWFCVCSDGTVKDEQDDYVTDTADLGIKVDTDPSLIKQFLKKKTSKIKVVFTTYQSGRATAKGSKGFTYDLGIMDEAHKTVGSKTKEMAHLLHQKNVKIKKRIFMTATERLFRGDSDEFMSMDDPRDYGDLIYELSFKEAINSKPPIISDYKIITFGITVPEIEEIYNSNKYLEVKKVLKDITARELATALALRKAIKKFKINNAISFHRSIRRADNFRTQQDLITKIYPGYGKLKSFHVAGDMPTADRATQMREFAKGKGLMTNARCLTEGVDLPAIDCVCFTDPKRSKVDIVQAAGRALRLSKGKKFGYILIPIFIPEGVDFDEAAEEQGFDDVAITVRALAATDKRIVEYLKTISEGKKPKGGSPVEGITSANSLYKIEADEFNNAVKLKLWDKLSLVIKQTYQEAKKTVQYLKIQSGSQYENLYNLKKIPLDLPAAPAFYYKNKGWKTWGEFLGTGRIADQLKDFVNFNELRKIVRQLKFKNSAEYVKNYKKIRHHKQIPYAPNVTYKNKGWINWANFLGTNKLQNIDYWSFEKSKKYIKKFNLRNQSDWYKFCKNSKPINIPSHPHVIYKNKGYKDLGHFIGSNNIANKNRFKNYLSYEEAKKFLRKSKITTQNQFKKYIKEKNLSLKIPYNPNSVYKKRGWKGFGDFLSTNRIADQNKHKLWWSEKKIKKFLKLNKIKNSSDWRQFCSEGKKPQFIPNNISKAFKKNTKISDIFINSQPRGKWVSFKKAKKLISNLNLKTNKDFFKMIKNNKVISNQLSKTPQVVYKNAGWNGWTDFLGKKK